MEPGEKRPPPTLREVLELVLLFFEGKRGADFARWEEILPETEATSETIRRVVRETLESLPRVDDDDLDPEDLMRAAQADGFHTHVMVFGREYGKGRSRLLVNVVHNCESPSELTEALWLTLERMSGQL